MMMMKQTFLQRILVGKILSRKRIKEPTAIFGRRYLLSAVVEAVNQEQIAVFLGQVAGFLKCTRHVIVIFFLLWFVAFWLLNSSSLFS